MQLAARLVARGWTGPPLIEGQVRAYSPTHTPDRVRGLPPRRSDLVSNGQINLSALTRSRGSARLTPRCRGSSC
jgi:hypothetical protein